MELTKVISIVLGAIASAAKKPLQRNKVFIRALKKCGLEPEHPPAEFSAVYNYALVEYALADEAGKLESLLKLFAAVYGEHNALISIESLDIIEGDLPKRAQKLVLEWQARTRKIF